MKDRIRIAQVGTNGMTHASQTLVSILKQSDIFELVAVSEPVDEWKLNLQSPPYRDVPHMTAEQLLDSDDIDAVAIETNEEKSTGYAQLFADRGIAVHLDKPGSPDCASFERLARTLQRKSLPFHLGYMYRFNPLIVRAMKEIEAGTFGDIISVEAQMSCLHTDQTRTRLERFPGGMMYYLGCHLVDLIYRIQGMPDEIMPLNSSTGRGGVMTEDYGFAALRYKNGISFIKTSAAEVNGFARRQLVISGTRATLEIKPLEEFRGGKLAAKGRFTLIDKAVSWGDCSEKWESEEFDRYDAMMRDFACQIRGEYGSPYGYDYEIAVHRMLMRCCGLC